MNYHHRMKANTRREDTGIFRAAEGLPFRPTDRITVTVRNDASPVYTHIECENYAP